MVHGLAEDIEKPEGNDVIGLQYGTNKLASQAGSGGFGSIRQIRNGKHKDMICLD